MKTNRAVFFDRDGTLNEEVGYLSDPERLLLYPGAARAVRMVKETGMMAVVVTNQSGVARGYFDESAVHSVHRRMEELLRRQGAGIDRFYYCPHHPDEGSGIYRRDCNCRKPKPGMFLDAAEELDLDLGRSYMIGDTMRDMEAARNAGVTGVLVKTGYGGSDGSRVHSFQTASDVLEAVTWIMRDSRR